MLPYIAIALIALFFLVLNADHVKGAEAIGLSAVVISMILIAGFRGLSVGTDTTLYGNMYYRIAASSNLAEAFTVSTISAPVYVSYAWVLGRLGFSYQSLLFLNAVITNVGIAIFIKRTSCKPLLSILIYFSLGMFFQSLNGMRQYTAVALVLNAYLDFWFYGLKKPRAWGLMLFALGIHSTSLIIMPGICAALYMRNRGRSRKGLLIVSLTAVLFSSALVFLTNIFVRIFPLYSMYNGIQNVAIFSGASGGRIRYLYAVLLIICLFATRSFADHDSEDDRESDMIYGLFPLCIISGIVGLVYGTSSLINRLLWFYMPGFISFIPAIVKKTEKGWSLLLRFGIFAALAVWLIAQFVENQDDMLPYILGTGLFA